MTLHATDATALVEIWAGIKNYVPAKDRRPAAEQFLAMVDDSGLVDLSIVSYELYGICDVFDKALKAYCQENLLDDTESSFNEWD